MATSGGEPDGKGEHRHTNRLEAEESPYLLQHAHNPVDWYPWGEEAFEKARSEDKPIFLSVGYSTCHWCHVMERESFENETVAAVMNEKFVNIKVDREERPDVDKVYMTFVQATSGGGGWPMSVFLTPDLKPFYGATYFPPDDRYGLPGFMTILNRVSGLWASKRTELADQGATVIEQLADAVVPALPEGNEIETLAASVIEECAGHFERSFDSARGGFGSAPKFPRPCELNLLVCQYMRKKADEPSLADKLLHIIQFTLAAMAKGGIYDHVGGGFHRYSVDEHWHVPHFEKMLYDNPQLAVTYLSGFQLTGDRRWAVVVRGVLDYLRRDMMHPDGGLYSAEDADSLDPVAGKKGEGTFYIWSFDEIDAILGPAKAKIFGSHYYVKREGNCDLSARSDPHKEFVGKNCLIERHSVSETATQFGVGELEVEKLLASCRQALHEARAKRPRPHLDNKVVAAWNGMAISAFALAARVLKSESPPVEPCFPVDGVDPSEYLSVAHKAAEFVRQHLWDDATGLLRRSFCKGPSSVSGFADDYACVVAGLLDLYEASGKLDCLKWATQLQERMNELFWDDKAGGYYSTSGKDPSILLRVKEDYDGAEPAASSIAASNLLRLGSMLNSDAYKTLGVT
ncbi:unnamed protein product, partial [Ostreobium quekettii]